MTEVELMSRMLRNFTLKARGSAECAEDLVQVENEASTMV